MAQGLQGIREAYTFDDVLLKPGLSDILPSEADIRSRVTRAIPLNIPIIASAMLPASPSNRSPSVGLTVVDSMAGDRIKAFGRYAQAFPEKPVVKGV